MASKAAGLTPLPIGSPIPRESLRAEMEARRLGGKRFRLREAIGIVVPLCTELAHLHATGKRLFVHPSSLRFESGSVHIVEELAREPPTHGRDRACLAPEERRGTPGDARASVFTLGAILYELLTNAVVGPGMRRPSELVARLPASVETLLGKALVADPTHRPGDLGALAQALHHAAPTASIAPPPADETHLDHDDTFDVDVSLSMIPPPPSFHVESSAVASVAVPRGISIFEAPRPPRAVDPTQQLAELKASLEADPRPRYVVIRDGMDHGPFTAVELLQQIASGLFLGTHALRDAFSADERLIQEWEEFAPFVDHARLNREIVLEKHAFEAATVAEKKGTRNKTIIGASLVGLFALGGGAYLYQERRNHERDLIVQTDHAIAIDVDAGLGAEKTPGKKPIGGRLPSGGAGNIPSVSDKGSCEAAINAYVEEYKIGNDNTPPDLGAGDYGAVLNRGGYMTGCGVPSSMEVNICAAVQNGRAVGVTVTTSPSNPGISKCIAGQVRGIAFPSHPRLDVARTTFAAN